MRTHHAPCPAADDQQKINPIILWYFFCLIMLRTFLKPYWSFIYILWLLILCFYGVYISLCVYCPFSFLFDFFYSCFFNYLFFFLQRETKKAGVGWVEKSRKSGKRCRIEKHDHSILCESITFNKTILIFTF